MPLSSVRTKSKEEDILEPKLAAIFSASNTIILSGDRHIGGLYEQILVNKYKLIELTSSSLNKPLPFKSLEKDSKQLGSVINESNFGIIKINWEKEDIILELRSSQKHFLAQKKPFIFKKLKLYNY